MHRQGFLLPKCVVPSPSKWPGLAGNTQLAQLTFSAGPAMRCIVSCSKNVPLGIPLKKRNTETRLEHSQNTIKDCKSTCHPRTKLAINIISHEMRTEATNQTLQERSSKGLFALDIVALERRHSDFSKAHTSLAEAS